MLHGGVKTLLKGAHSNYTIALMQSMRTQGYGKEEEVGISHNQVENSTKNVFPLTIMNPLGGIHSIASN